MKLAKLLSIIAIAAPSAAFAQDAKEHAHGEHDHAHGMDFRDLITENPAAEMAEAASLFLKSLSAAEKTKAVFAKDHEHREGWYYVPGKFIKPAGKRQGLCIKDMTPQQRLLAHGLLASVTSSQGYRTAVGIMTLEQVLHEKENGNPIRDPEDYYVSIFGEPTATGSWGWRFEGHHLSVNVAIAKGKLFSVTPSFFATNPGIVDAGPFEKVELLATEQDLARALAKSLTEEQRKLAFLEGDVPADIITKQERRAERETFLPAKGIPFSKLNDVQKGQLLELVAAYASKYRPAILAEILSRKPVAPEKPLHFAWIGGLEPGQGHYYRIQTEQFLFEYDNTQNGANHIHAVWRDFDGDFGRDLLGEHHEHAH